MGALPGGEITWTQRLLRIAGVIAFLVVFLVGVKLLGSSFKMVGKDTAHSLFEGLKNPFAGLAVGILATVLVQSSSVTTAVVVGLVGDGSLDVTVAVPVIMGANIGTSVTNTLVSIGHITRSAEFKRAFAGATVHDFFNLITVVVLLPIELATGFLQKAATWLTGLLAGTSGVTYKSPIKKFIGAIVGELKDFITGMGLEGWWAASVALVVGLACIIIALYVITKTMRSLLAGRLEHALNRALGRSALLGMGVGVLITVAVQSSSITTSLLIPLIGAGVLRLDVAFPITLGANIGTTVTALLAALAADKTAGLTIALVHLLFNITGILMIYPFPALRRIPLRLAEGLGELAVRNRLYVLAYILTMFVFIPLVGVLLFRG
ncbi:MAG: Na/Pi symporter [Planctomycetota bacterium]|jgi:sodium-dependent phosphate cotransporter